MAHPLKKSDHKREEPKLGEPKLVHPDDAAEIPIAQELTGERVADTLVRARQQLGQDLRSIAQVLCIRYSYLDAIERGQYESLPGPTYAVGFMRSYADYLGLDSEQIIDRFKSEVEGLDSQTKLHFPVPAPEGKMPGGAVFLVAALLFAGAYGVWFYLSNQGESFGDLVAPVPEQLQNLVDGTSPPATPPATPADPPADPTAPEAGSPQAGTPVDQPPAAAPAPVPETQSSISPAPAAGAATPATRAAAPEAPADQIPADQPPAAPAPAAQASAATDEADDSAVPRQSPSQQPPAARTAATASSATASSAAESSAAESPAAAEPYAIPAAPEGNGPASAFLLNHEPKVYGEENADARIVLKAHQDAWVQVRDREGDLLLTRVLRVGDSYRVPNRADLTLLTGNAGGLEISVDGTPLPALGPVGAVRRNIPLDPQALRGGAGRQP